MWMSTTAQGAGIDARYPIGDFVKPARVDEAARLEAVAALAEMPGKLRRLVEGLDREQLDTPYRERGWTVRQLVHHIADSHMQAFARVRLALTEDWPTIKPYEEKGWSELDDSQSAPVDWSLGLIDGLHARWVMLLQSLTEEQWKRGFKHPERGENTVEITTLLYAWHGRHHVAHIARLIESRGWEVGG
jgi:hypothetical protein